MQFIWSRAMAIAVVLSLAALSGTAWAADNWVLTDKGFKAGYADTAPGDSVTWSGGADADGYAEGAGILQWYINGEASVRYEGMMTQGGRTGQGSLTWANGDRYEGGFAGDKLTGEGIFAAANGDRYEGGFLDGKSHGKGIFTWANGDRYEGDWVDNKRTGTGVLTWANGDRYEGGFVADKAHGKGIYAWANGDRYEGDFANDRQNGKGIFTAANGDRYVGGFVDDRRSGKGSFAAANGDRYEGDWGNGKANGKGVFTTANGDRYEGDFVDGKARGRGSFTSANGDRYEGGFAEDRRSGKGVFTWANGDRYEGDFADDKLHGYGTFYRRDGATKKGYWSDGEYAGQTAPAYSAATARQIENKVVNKIFIEGNAISAAKHIFAALPALQEGRTVDTRALSDEILLANENDFRKLTVNFRPNGDKLDAYVLVKEVPATKIAVSADNSGDEYTGRLRARLTYLDGNVGGTGQTFLLGYTTSPDHAADVKQFGLLYNIPLPHSKDNVYLTASYSDVNSGRIIDLGPLTIDATGKGSGVGLHYVHSFARTPQEKTGLDIGLDARRYDNGTILTFVGTPVDIGVDIDTMPFSVSYKGSKKQGSDEVNYSLGFVHNIPGGGKNSTAQYRLYRYDTSANYRLWRGSFNYRHEYPGGWIANIALAGQYTNERLIYPEQLFLGGMWSLRGLDEQAVAGDRGVQGRFELYSPEIARGQRVVLFVDAGYFDNVRPVAGDLTRDAAVSCGLGWRYSGGGYTVVADYGYMLNGTATTPAHSGKFHFAVTRVF